MGETIPIRNRITEFRKMRLGDIAQGPDNWRLHPKSQVAAFLGLVEEVGWFGVPLIYWSEKENSWAYLDGNMRGENLPDFEADVGVTDFTDEDIAEPLTTYDTISAVAEAHREKLGALLQRVKTGNEGVQALLAGLAEREGVFFGGLAGGNGGEQPEPRQTLAERFVVPPFSVLDARQGYWQERKRAWISLGIQSELGRGEGIVPNSSIRPPEHDGAWLRCGGSRFNSNVVNTIDGVGLKIDAYRRQSGERSRRRLTWVAGDRPPENLDETSRKNLAAGRKGPARSNGQDLMRGENDNFRQQADRRSNLTGAPLKPPWAVSTGTENMATGTSIFDPVLCELAYRWFCPPAGRILDPFAGGSVRGIVAAILGRKYTGIDLSEAQIEANEWQANVILADKLEPVTVMVSGKWARHKFPCWSDYITDNCKGRCCEGTDKILISLLPDEAEQQEAAGFDVIDGLLQPDPETGKCSHKQANGLCGVHGTDMKPFGCIASPFTLNKNGTLIVRNRYSKFKCHGNGDEAYKTFRASLDLIFGEDEAERVCAELEAGVANVEAEMPRQSYDNLLYLDGLKHGTASHNGNNRPEWIVGDSRNLHNLVADDFDFVFTCPPYFDLEIYSDDERDLSNAGGYDAFVDDYRAIIAESVKRLKDDRFACIVVGDIRDKKGFYRNFVSDTIAAFQDAGVTLYNEAILVTAVGSLPIRVGKQFEAGRKLGKTHQNVLVFCKGDPRKATEAIGVVEVGDIEQQIDKV